MDIVKTLIIQERKNDWVIKIKVEGARSVGPRPRQLATFCKSPSMGIIMAANAFNHMSKLMMIDYQEIHATAEGITDLERLGVKLVKPRVLNRA